MEKNSVLYFLTDELLDVIINVLNDVLFWGLQAVFILPDLHRHCGALQQVLTINSHSSGLYDDRAPYIHITLRKIFLKLKFKVPKKEPRVPVPRVTVRLCLVILMLEMVVVMNKQKSSYIQEIKSHFEQ